MLDRSGPGTRLTEARSKKLLAEFDVPVVPEVVAHSVEAAVTEAGRLGYPVVLKGHGAALAHKTERGLVKLNLLDAAAVAGAGHEVARAAGEDLEGFLVQPMLVGRRELVAGLFRDPVFGPVVMFGLGGVFTEVLDDVVFRLAPLTVADAEEMLEEIRSADLLGGFRGEAPADREALVAVLLGLSRLAAERPDVAEVDVNPLLVTGDGAVWAVDALVVLDEMSRPVEERPRVAPVDLGTLFNPASIAFIGASGTLGKWGQRLPMNLLAGGFPGEIYLVNPRGGTIAGRSVYPRVGDIPGPVELAVITIPAEQILALVPQLRAKGVRHAVVISSGFGEVGEQGAVLERRLVDAAREAGLVFLGPNTMGIANPPASVHMTAANVCPAAGTTALISQSGNMGVQLLGFAERQGLGIRAFGGSGNEAMISVEDFMEAFEVDRLTRTVLLYVESVKNGRRFFESARRVGRKKPVVVLKGGRTEAGGVAAASHTGALASDFKVFKAACRQAGVVLVDQSMDMLDTSAAFSSLPLPTGRRVAIMTLGGGWGVVTSDLCEEHGLEIVPLPGHVLAKLDRLLPTYWSRANPVDLVGENDPELPGAALQVLMEWDGCDAVINLGILGKRFLAEGLLRATAAVDPDADEQQLRVVAAQAEADEQHYVEQVVRLMERYNKPILGVSLATGASERTLFEVAGSTHKGVFFPSPERAVQALSHMCDYQDFLSRPQ